MARSVELISWDAFRQRLNEEGVWTLVHGDYHPANQLYDPDSNQITTVDWEMVGIGSGP